MSPPWRNPLQFNNRDKIVYILTNFKIYAKNTKNEYALLFLHIRRTSIIKFAQSQWPSETYHRWHDLVGKVNRPTLPTIYNKNWES